MRKAICLAVLACGTAVGQGMNDAAKKASDAMAASVMKAWPNGAIATTKAPAHWGYEEGVLLDGLTEQWHQTANGDEFRYIKAAVDKYVTKDGTIQMDDTGRAFTTDEHQLDNIELGRAIVMLYRVTQDARYYKAAKFLEDQLALQPRAENGGYWHKTIYPNQMWLDGAFMAEPFRAEYAATFQQPGDFDDITQQFLLMYEHMRDPKSGLLKHGWDVSKQMPWADKTTGLSPEVWARALGWYCVALVDVLDWIPEGNPNREKLLAVLTSEMSSVTQYQDYESGLWWQVMDKGPQLTGTVVNGQMQYHVDKPAMKGNFLEASASAMFVYSIAKGVRLGYLPQYYEQPARKGWQALQTKFVTANPDGTVTLTGTVKVGGLGGKPYRSGTFDYYASEPTGDNDAKGVGAYLLAGSEMEQTDTASVAHGAMSFSLGSAPAGKGNVAISGLNGKTGAMTMRIDQGSSKTVLLDAWFNSQTRKNAAGQTELFHYKWDDDANSGFAFFGRAFQSYGAKLAEEKTAPTAGDLKKAQIYILASPDIPAKNPNPHYMDKASGDAIEAWVKEGGVLLLLENDNTNSEFEHFNTLSERFGIHFNPVLRNAVVNNQYEMGRLNIPATTGVFKDSHVAYLKEISTISVKGAAKAVYTDKGDAIMAVAKVGKGTVFAVTDPWFYNEYVDHRNKLPLEYDTYATAKDLARWAIEQAK